MNRIELENRLLHELRYISVETLEKMLEFVSFFRNENHNQQIVRQQPLAFYGNDFTNHSQVKLSLKELLLQGPTLTTEECQQFEENRKWMELWDQRF